MIDAAAAGTAGVSVLIVEGRALYRDALAALLDGFPGFTVVGTAADVLEAVHACRRLCPQVVLLQVQSDADPLEHERAAMAMRAYSPGLISAVILEGPVVTALPGFDCVFTARLDGRELARELWQIIARRTHEEAHIRREIGGRTITAREGQILLLVAEGLSNKEIAGRTGIGLQTVKNHVSHLLEKLSLEDRTQLALYVQSSDRSEEERT